MQRLDVLVQLGYICRHVSAVNRPSSGQKGIVLLRYSQAVCPMGQLGYICRHVSAVNRPSSGQKGIVLLRYSQAVCPMGSHWTKYLIIP